jgi:hypothetical protein
MQLMEIQTYYIPGMPTPADAVPPFSHSVRPDPIFLHISSMIKVPADQRELHITFRANAFRDRSWAIFCLVNDALAMPYETDEIGELLKYSIRLNHGQNKIEFQMPVSIPVADRLDDGFELDFERYCLCVDVPVRS